jgi:hypothetical protein
MHPLTLDHTHTNTPTHTHTHTQSQELLSAASDQAYDWRDTLEVEEPQPPPPPSKVEEAEGRSYLVAGVMAATIVASVAAQAILRAKRQNS